MVPPFEEFLSNSLAFFVDGKPHSKQELLEYYIKIFNLTEEDCKVLTKKGSRTQLEDRVAWAIHYLKKAGLIASQRKGRYAYYIITERGKHFYTFYPHGFTNKELANWSSNNEDRNKKTFPEEIERVEISEDLIDHFYHNTALLEEFSNHIIRSVIKDYYKDDKIYEDDDDDDMIEWWNSLHSFINDEKKHSSFIEALVTDSFSEDDSSLNMLYKVIQEQLLTVKNIQYLTPDTHLLHTLTGWSGIQPYKVMSTPSSLLAFLSLSKMVRLGIHIFAKMRLSALEKEILIEAEKYVKGGIEKWLIGAKRILVKYITGKSVSYLQLLRNVFQAQRARPAWRPNYESRHLPLADLAYKTFGIGVPSQVDILLTPIKLSFNGQSLSHSFDLANDLKGIIGEYDGDYYLSFRGTNSLQNVITDIHQFISGADISYLMAIGILSKLCEQFPNKRIYVTGHSLGGGLAQYATLAINDRHVSAFCYNSAGLSYDSVEQLKNWANNKQWGNLGSQIYHLHVSSDLVFRLGNQFGYCRTIPSHKNVWEAHKLDTIRELTNCKDIAWFK